MRLGSLLQFKGAKWVLKALLLPWVLHINLPFPFKINPPKCLSLRLLGNGGKTDEQVLEVCCQSLIYVPSRPGNLASTQLLAMDGTVGYYQLVYNKSGKSRALKVAVIDEI